MLDALQKQLRQSEERYHALVQAAGQISWLTPANGMVEDIPLWRAYTGQSEEQVKGWGWLEALHPDDREYTAQSWSNAVTTKTPYEIEYRIRHHTGSYRHFLARGVPVLNADGSVQEWVGYCTDISERKQAEEKHAELLRREQAARAEADIRAGQIEAAFEAIADAVLVCDNQGMILQANTAARELWEPEQKATFHQLAFHERVRQLPILNKQGQPFSEEDMPLRRLLNGEVLRGASAVDELYLTPDGRQVALSAAGAPVRNSQGEITGAVMLFRDVTERRRLEQRTEEALNALLTMAEALVSNELPSNGASAPATRGNPTAQRLAELTRSFLGCRLVSIGSLAPGTDIVRPVAIVGLPLEQELQWWAEQPEGSHLSESSQPELVARLLAGEVLVLDLTKPPFNEQPNPYGVLNVLMAPMRIGEQLTGILALDYGEADHTYTEQEIALSSAVAKFAALVIERERLTRERAEAQARVLALQEANQRMDVFLGTASHELKTPLTGIKASIQLSQRRAKEVLTRQDQSADDLVRTITTLQSLLDRSARQVNRLNRLVDDLLDVSRIQAGKLELRPQLADLATIVREVVQEEQQLVPTRIIHFQRPEGQAITVSADPDRISQVMSNYLTNALKYSAEDQPVEVGLEVFSQQARFLVRDQGPGLSPIDQERVWERFYRAAGIEVQSGSGVGLGLGLYISRTIIERHHGQVGIQSAPGEGSTFWFTLPLAEEQPAESTKRTL